MIVIQIKNNVKQNVYYDTIYYIVYTAQYDAIQCTHVQFKSCGSLDVPQLVCPEFVNKKDFEVSGTQIIGCCCQVCWSWRCKDIKGVSKMGLTNAMFVWFCCGIMFCYRCGYAQTTFFVRVHKFGLSNGPDRTNKSFITNCFWTLLIPN